MGFYHRHDFEDWKETPVSEPTGRGGGHRDWDGVMKAACLAPRHRLVTLSGLLGVSLQALAEYEIGWLSRNQLYVAGTKCWGEGAWTFPMRDENGKVIGIRLRSDQNAKFAMKHSEVGLFYHPSIKEFSPLLVVDGATDALTGFARSLNVVGRPSATGGFQVMQALIRRLKPSRLECLLDRDKMDNPIYEQAFDSAREIVSVNGSGCVFYPPPPHKDLRQWLEKQRLLPNRLRRLVATCTSTATPSPA